MAITRNIRGLFSENHKNPPRITSQMQWKPTDAHLHGENLEEMPP
jgi:hypothetical protein